MRRAITRYDPATSRALMLTEAARLVHHRHYDTLCEALSAILPRNGAGDDAWRDAKGFLYPMVPDCFEQRGGWWKNRGARVIGGLLAAAMARDAEQQLREGVVNEPPAI